MKGFMAVVSWDADSGRILKSLDFSTMQEAQDHVAKVAATYPDAFAAISLDAPLRDWKVNPSGKALMLEPFVSSPKKADQEVALVALLIDKGIFTQAELDAKRDELAT